MTERFQRHWTVVYTDTSSGKAEQTAKTFKTEREAKEYRNKVGGYILPPSAGPKKG